MQAPSHPGQPIYRAGRREMDVGIFVQSARRGIVWVFSGLMAA